MRNLFREKTGFDVLDFMGLSLATFGAVNDGAQSLRANYFSPLIGTYTEATISSFLSSIALTYPELVRFCRSLTNTEIKVASEFFEFPVLTRYPFFRSGETMICWHPMVLYRGLESFVHSVLSEHGQECMERFSRLFEQHVVTEAQRVPTRFIGEGELREYIDVETQVPDGLTRTPKDCCRSAASTCSRSRISSAYQAPPRKGSSICLHSSRRASKTTARRPPLVSFLNNI